jgi:hypothetical protein
MGAGVSGVSGVSMMQSVLWLETFPPSLSKLENKNPPVFQSLSRQSFRDVVRSDCFLKSSLHR